MKRLYWLLIPIFFFSFAGIIHHWAIHVIHQRAVTTNCSGSVLFKWINPSSTTVTAGGGCSDGDSTGTLTGTAQITGGAVVTTDTGTNGLDFYAFDMSSFDLEGETLGTAFVRVRVTTWVDGGDIRAVITDANDYRGVRVTGAADAIDFQAMYSGVNGSTTATANVNGVENTWYWIRYSWRTTASPYLQIEVFSDNAGVIGTTIATGNSTTDIGGFTDNMAANGFRVGTWADGGVVEISYLAVYNDWRTEEGGGSVVEPVIAELSRVPALCDETATYVFSSTMTGTITYGGTCGNADQANAVAGTNTVIWTFVAEATHSNCTIKVTHDGVDSNTLNIPAFKTTDKYPVVFVHGLYGSGAAWNEARTYLEGQGWEPSLLIANSMTVNNSVLCSTAHPPAVQGWIEAALNLFPGFDQVDLIGHSRGGSNIMRGLWHGDIDDTMVRNAITMSGANRACATTFPAIPGDETPGTVLYSVYWSTNDANVAYSVTYVTGAYEEDLITLTHSQMRTTATAHAAMKAGLEGNGCNSGVGIGCP